MNPSVNRRALLRWGAACAGPLLLASCGLTKVAILNPDIPGHRLNTLALAFPSMSTTAL